MADPNPRGGDKARRLELYRELHNGLLCALGYVYRRDVADSVSGSQDGTTLPLIGRVADGDGRQALWIFDAPLGDPSDADGDPLSAAFTRDQFREEDLEAAELERPLEQILAEGVFDLPDGPRHVLVLGLSQIVLIDRRKWPARSVLRFDLQEIFTRQDRDTLSVMACLVAREARVPEQGVPVSELLEEEAQRNANAVTSSLKRTVRDAIEILGQEVLDVTNGKYPSGPRKDVWIDGPELSLECLRYMYRLLFLFYAEANPRLRILDLKDPLYASGYSIEALRDLESRRLRTPAEKDGTYIWDSLQRTLSLLYAGESDVMRLPAVKVSLLDPQSTPLLSSVKLRNDAMQKVIRLLSLRSSGRGTGRISYAKLGIGQLGAVYETLISFTGVVAKTDLIELKARQGRGTDDGTEEGGDEEEGDDEPAEDEVDHDDFVDEAAGADNGIYRKDDIDTLAPSWFVPRSRIGEFVREEVVFNGEEARVYPKGTFIYRLAGRDREKSAAYYTPEPLARLLVKHALMERCRDLTADGILELKILEPAMGSAAFLVETTNQLADLYLEGKQKETGRTIPQDRIVLEKQKVRAYIADRNCFGVDLNPIAVELGAISLWLNGLHAGRFSPWFGDQLHAGNSLLGARRAAYPPDLLTARKQADLWYNAGPDEIGWRRRLPENHVWQWLLPARDMANFHADKSINPFAGEAQERIRAWRRGGFFKKLESHEVKLVQKLSRIAEAMFDRVAEDLARTREAANDEITLWPDRVMPGNRQFDFRGKGSLNARLTGADRATDTLPYKRLKTAMDAWCALWLWPLDKAHLLPDRAAFLQGMAMILEGGFTPDGSLAAPGVGGFYDPAPDFFDQLEPDAPARDLFKAAAGRQEGLFRETNVEALVETFDWLGVAVEVAGRARFVHFDLIFADVLKMRGGFDLIVGNPPWVKPVWNEGLVLADIDPLHAGLSATEARKVLPDALSKGDGRKRFLREFVATRGAMKITSSDVMHPFAGGGSNNLYRCFIDLSFRLVAPAGYAALIHQDGHLGDPKSGAFRRHWYARARKHFEFSNKMKTRMFAEVHSALKFSLNVYRGETGDVRFENFTSAFLPSQIEDSYADRDGLGDIPGTKGPDGRRDTRGHRDRVIEIDRDALSVIHALSEDENTPIEEARFIQPYSARTLDLFRRIARVRKLDAAIPTWQMGHDWNETTDQRNGIFRRETAFRPRNEMILQGPLFYVGNPLYKTPKAVSMTNKDYDVIDLTAVLEDYLPRTNYGPAVDMAEYRSRMKKCEWDQKKNYVDFYRVAFRNMIGLNNERSLIGALIPPEIAHVNTVESVAFADDNHILTLLAAATSLAFDFMIKATGRKHLFGSDVAKFPWADIDDTAKHRSLRLACLTSAYADFWNRYAPILKPLPWSSPDPRLRLEGPLEGPPEWERSAGLRTEFARRMALVEIDVLVAQALGLSLEQLIEVYRIYFPVLQQNEAGTWYDRQGRIVWTCSKGLPGIGWLDERGKRPGRAAWEKILADDRPELICTALDDTMPGGPRQVTRRFTGPFTQCDRIEDYRRAWGHFERLKSHGAA